MDFLCFEENPSKMQIKIHFIIIYDSMIPGWFEIVDSKGWVGIIYIWLLIQKDENLVFLLFLLLRLVHYIKSIPLKCVTWCNSMNGVVEHIKTITLHIFLVFANPSVVPFLLESCFYNNWLDKSWNGTQFTIHICWNDVPNDKICILYFANLVCVDLSYYYLAQRHSMFNYFFVFCFLVFVLLLVFL